MNNRLVRCKTCGAEIARTASRCPHCGAQQHVGALCACVLIALAAAFACIFVAVRGIGGESQQPQKAPVATSTVSVTAADTETYDDISSIFAQAFPNEQISVKKRDRYLLTVVTMENASTEKPASDWDSTLSSLCNATVESCNVLSENEKYTLKNMVGQIVNGNGDILATVYNGKVMYTAYRDKAELEEENRNSATITQHEFDMISIGMRYSDVVEIIGGEGALYTEIGSAGSAVGDYKSYVWYGEGSFPGWAVLTFKDYELYGKVAYGLS